MEIVVSGTRPTGVLHLGNYFGAVRNYVRMQEQEHQTYFFIADYHALTTHNQPELLDALVKETAATYLAAGLDPEKSCLYVQSDVPQTTELYLLFNMVAYKGELEKVPTFKEKVRRQPENVNAGLLTYPVLMAADILIHRATKVPVGKDQEQHLEMTRNFAQRFNRKYGRDYFPEPVAYNFGEQLVKVPGLDGSGKMSKSDNPSSAIFLNDADDAIRKKIMRAKTDTGPTAPGQELSVEVGNLLDLLDLVGQPGARAHFEEAHAAATIRYGDLKKQLAEDMVRFVAPIRERITEITADRQRLNRILKDGGERARISADETVRNAREMTGIRYY
jgi:tryptophanyl-tRNA synthetase